MNRPTLCLALLLATVYHSNGDLTIVPQNVAVIQGTTITLSCSVASSPSARVMWSEMATTDEPRILSDGKALIPAHPNAQRYAITGGPLDFNLQIVAVTMADGGRYTCQDVNAVPGVVSTGIAEVIVLNGNPICTDLETVTGVLVEDRFYWKECDLRYHGNLVPIMTWTGPGTFQNDNSVTESDVWSRISFTANRTMEGFQFVCTTNFEFPGGMPPDHATNTPDYQYVFSGSTIIVNWGPKDLTITPQQPYYMVGDVLTCQADAKPNPTYIWHNVRTLEEFPPGQTFTVTQELMGTDQVMRCNVFSMIEGILYTEDVFVNMSVPGISITTTPAPTTPPTPPPADSPCNDLTGQWTSTNPNALLCIEMDFKGNLLGLLRNGTDAFFVTGNGKTVAGDDKHVGFTAIWPTGSMFGAGAFAGECHRCFGNEIILMSGLSRNKANAPGCGQSAGTRLTNLYAFTRYGPPCRTPGEKVYRPSAEHIRIFDIKPENIIT